MKNLFFLTLATLTLATACKKDDPATPSTMQLSGTFASSAEIPAVTTPSTGSGTVSGTFDKSTMLLTYNINFTGLTAPATIAHFHFGDAKHMGPVFVPFNNVPSATSGTITGSTPLTAAQADSLMLGHVYANIHTVNNKPGEIRSNVVVK